MNLKLEDGIAGGDVYNLCNEETQRFIKEHIKEQGRKYVRENLDRVKENMRKVTNSLTRDDRIALGRKGGKYHKMNKTGAFCDPILRKSITRKGGATQGKRNALSGHCKKISTDYWRKVKTGEIIRQSRIWITNGIINKQHLLKDEIPLKFYKGMVKG